MPTTALTLLTKPGCHLCDDAREIVNRVVGEILEGRLLDAQTAGDSISVTELSILDDPQLAATYAEEIPVILIDGAVHTIWRVDPGRLRAALDIRPWTL